jgi:hypothetical protein
MDPHARAERRRKAIALATAAPVNRDTPASAFMSVPPLDAAIIDLQREALERAWGDGRGDPSEPQGYKVGFLQLRATLAGVRSAHTEGDSAALRGELVNLAAQAAVWASALPVPMRRRTRANAAA